VLSSVIASDSYEWAHLAIVSNSRFQVNLYKNILVIKFTSVVIYSMLFQLFSATLLFNIVT
jgi:hypothetical protein